MSQAERKPKEFLRNPNVYSVDDACGFARDIIRKSAEPVTESGIVSVAWEQAGCKYNLWVSNWEAHRPEYLFACDDTELDILRTYTFPTAQGNVFVGNPNTKERWRANIESDLPELMSHLATNEQKVREPQTDGTGLRMFERIAAHYALTEIRNSPISGKIASINLIDDPASKDSARADIIEAIQEQALEIDGDFYPYTRSSGFARQILESYLNQNSKKR